MKVCLSSAKRDVATRHSCDVKHFLHLTLFFKGQILGLQPEIKSFASLLLHFCLKQTSSKHRTFSALTNY